MRTRLRRQSAAGFTLIELIVVMVMVGVLFSIAAPGWLAFANRQRVNSVRDEMLQEIRRSQAIAAQTRRNQIFTLNTEADPPTVQVEPTDPQPRVLGKGQIQANMIELATTDEITEIEFDDKGNLVSDDDLPEEGLKFTVSLIDSPNVKSCAIVQTLLGATRTASGEQCD